MSLSFYSEGESQEKEESINKYSDLFQDYLIESPNLSEALRQMFISAKVDENEIDDLIKDILSKSENRIKDSFKDIKNKFPKISKEDAIIICSYTCESKKEKYSPYRLLNTGMVSRNRKKGIQIFIFIIKFIKKITKILS